MFCESLEERTPMHLTRLESYPDKAVFSAIAQRLRDSVIKELQPIIDAIAASQRDGQFFTDRDVSVTLPATQGKTLVVSVRTASPSSTPLRGPMPSGLDARQLRLVDGAIREKIGEPLSVSTLSSIAGLSRSHFSHVFRATVGRTPHAHIVRLRIERAMKLMIDTDVPLSEIALATGFSDQAHFSNTFRRTLGVTPKQWRRDQRGGAAIAARASA
jgi:transcriptional regulator GlxA family with amidase domain